MFATVKHAMLPASRKDSVRMVCDRPGLPGAGPRVTPDALPLRLTLDGKALVENWRFRRQGERGGGVLGRR